MNSEEGDFALLGKCNNQLNRILRSCALSLSKTHTVGLLRHRLVLPNGLGVAARAASCFFSSSASKHRSNNLNTCPVRKNYAPAIVEWQGLRGLTHTGAPGQPASKHGVVHRRLEPIVGKLGQGVAHFLCAARLRKTTLIIHGGISSGWVAFQHFRVFPVFPAWLDASATPESRRRRAPIRSLK